LRARGWLSRFGPGLITGASDDDPSGLATYSQVGSQFGFGLLWTMVLTYPLMAGMQEISARIGLVTGHGLAANLRTHFSPILLHVVVGLLLVANVINIGADIGAMAAALRMLLGGPITGYIVGFSALSVGLQVAAVASPAARNAGPFVSNDHGFDHGNCRDLWHDDQSISLLLAGI